MIPPAPARFETAEMPAVLDRIRASGKMAGLHEGTEVTFQALGSPCRLWIGSPSSSPPGALIEAIFRWLAEFEAVYSRFLPGSWIARVNRAAGREWVALDARTESMLGLCHEMHFLSRGTFDPTALPLVQLWDWKKATSVPDAAAIEAARRLTGWRKVQRAPGRIFLPEPGMALDLGGMGKEYAVDHVTQMLSESGASGGLVDFGADVRVFGRAPQGKPAWHVGLEDPARPGHCWTGLAVRDAAVATSGDYRRHFVVDGRRYGHIIDVRTGHPVSNGCRAVSVVAPSCSLAGMLSTAAFVLGPQEGLRLIDSTPNAEGCLVAESGTLTSRRFYELATR